jgi:hypothetical protein
MYVCIGEEGKLNDGSQEANAGAPSPHTAYEFF